MRIRATERVALYFLHRHNNQKQKVDFGRVDGALASKKQKTLVAVKNGCVIIIFDLKL